MHLLLLLLPQLAHGYRTLANPSSFTARAAVRASEGPPEKVQPPPLYYEDASASEDTSRPPTEDEDAPVVLGARILGAGFGGVTGNALFSSLDNIGFTACTPFNKDGCQALIQEQQLQQATQQAAQPQGIPPAAGAEQLQQLQQAAQQAAQQTPPASAAEQLQQLQQLQQQLKQLQLQQQLEQLQQLQKQMASLVTVPPASASTVPFDAAIAVDSSRLDLVGSSLDFVGFSAVADGGGSAPLLATVLCAVFGAIAFEVIATNKVPPIPDPFLGGVWSSLHALVRGPSKATGFAVTSAFAAIKGVVGGEQNKS